MKSNFKEWAMKNTKKEKTDKDKRMEKGNKYWCRKRDQLVCFMIHLLYTMPNQERGHLWKEGIKKKVDKTQNKQSKTTNHTQQTPFRRQYAIEEKQKVKRKTQN